jgi:hypothetical protein
MGEWEQSVPRGGDDLLVPGCSEAESDIHGGEARSDEEHRVLVVDVGEGARSPGIPDPSLAGATQWDWPSLGRWPGGEDHPITGHDRTRGQYDLHSISTRHDVDCFGTDVVGRLE